MSLSRGVVGLRQLILKTCDSTDAQQPMCSDLLTYTLTPDFEERSNREFLMTYETIITRCPKDFSVTSSRHLPLQPQIMSGYWLSETMWRQHIVCSGTPPSATFVFQWKVNLFYRNLSNPKSSQIFQGPSMPQQLLRIHATPSWPYRRRGEYANHKSW